MDEALYRLHAEREETYWWWVAKNRIILRLIERYGPRVAGNADGESRPRAIDIGCGAGGVLARLSERFDAVGVDLSPIAREYCDKRGLRAVDGALPDGLPFRDADAFDVVVASEVLEHIDRDVESVREMVRITKPGGIIVCTVPAHGWLWSAHDDFNHHRRRYTRRGFGALFDGLAVETLVLSYCQLASMPLVIGARLVERARGAITGRAPAEAEVRPLPGMVDRVLRAAFEAEKHVLPHVRLPTGTSVISVHRKRG
ncbi:MAG: class I SAM-dependent methyltransferase [Phycisphaeraceae bacterium]|nr:class I SAM-dependent methyltransferase [Phycisphaeraceae bacterium]